VPIILSCVLAFFKQTCIHTWWPTLPLLLSKSDRCNRGGSRIKDHPSAISPSGYHRIRHTDSCHAMPLHMYCCSLLSQKLTSGGIRIKGCRSTTRYKKWEILYHCSLPARTFNLLSRSGILKAACLGAGNCRLSSAGFTNSLVQDEKALPQTDGDYSQSEYRRR
jgi:hypothetical protein